MSIHTDNAIGKIEASLTTVLPVQQQQAIRLPELIDHAANALVNAKSSAEVLEARDMASAAYDAAKTTARLLKAKQAHDELIAAVCRAQADALVIEAEAKRRLADEYDEAQERGEIRTAGHPNSSDAEDLPGVAEIGITHKDVHEARRVRDAELAEPGIVRRVVDEALAAGDEPSKAKVRRAVQAVARPQSEPNQRVSAERLSKTDIRRAKRTDSRISQAIRAVRAVDDIACLFSDEDEVALSPKMLVEFIALYGDEFDQEYLRRIDDAIGNLHAIKRAVFRSKAAA